jgi:hypothetical protein
LTFNFRDFSINIGGGKLTEAIALKVPMAHSFQASYLVRLIILLVITTPILVLALHADTPSIDAIRVHVIIRLTVVFQQ